MSYSSKIYNSSFSLFYVSFLSSTFGLRFNDVDFDQ